VRFGPSACGWDLLRACVRLPGVLIVEVALQNCDIKKNRTSFSVLEMADSFGSPERGESPAFPQSLLLALLSNIPAQFSQPNSG